MPRNQSSGGPAFAEALNELIRQSGMQQSEVAQRLDVWDSLVHRWRKGGGISHRYVLKLADLFGVDRKPLERLAGYDDTPLLASEPASDPILELERIYWHKWFEDLRTTRVPRWAWTAYTAACEALAERYRDLEPSDNPGLVTPESERQSQSPPPTHPEKPSPPAGGTDDPPGGTGTPGKSSADTPDNPRQSQQKTRSHRRKLPGKLLSLAMATVGGLTTIGDQVCSPELALLAGFL